MLYLYSKNCLSRTLESSDLAKWAGCLVPSLVTGCAGNTAAGKFGAILSLLWPQVRILQYKQNITKQFFIKSCAFNKLTTASVFKTVFVFSVNDTGMVIEQTQFQCRSTSDAYSTLQTLKWHQCQLVTNTNILQCCGDSQQHSPTSSCSGHQTSNTSTNAGQVATLWEVPALSWGCCSREMGCSAIQGER